MPPTQQKETPWKVCSVFPHRIIEDRPEIKDDADQFAIAIFGGPKRFERAAKVVQAVNSHATLVAALEPFALMHREGCDHDEVACSRGAASDMTMITSGDFARARAALARTTEEAK